MRIRDSITTVPDPAKWYEQSYSYEISTRISAAIISLDNLVTETARNDFDKINRDIMTTYKMTMERDGKSWGRTPDSAAYVHSKSPELTDINAMQDMSTQMSAVATAAGGILATLLFGVGGIVGTIGASTAARMITKNKINNEIEKARAELCQYVENDVGTVLSEATKDCEARISIIYADMGRAVLMSESTWMKIQMEAISDAAKPAEESAAKAEESIKNKIIELSDVSASLNNFID